MIKIERYRAEWAEKWNRTVRESKNGTFLFDRGYMDYHSDRFADHSLVFSDEEDNGKWLAVMPANEREGVLYSHQGLTYGGLIMTKEITVMAALEMFRLLMQYAREKGLQRIIYKAVPWIFHTMPAEEDLYALTQVCHARLVQRSISIAIQQSCRLPLNRSRRNAVKRAQKAGLTVSESTDYAAFWRILCDNLSARFDATPVHTLEEIRLLHEHFPEQIRLFTASLDGEMLGGVVVYVCGPTAHTQYTSASPLGKKLGAIDAIITHLTDDVFTDLPYFNFGTSCDEGPFGINETLIYQKQSFGGRGVCYDTYEITLNQEL